ncbi:MAG: 50S ribosomal protein L24 [Parcubacteria group bacterium]|nr:50S ribosomal protein L24 [Parcubacteria group bacterium]
MNIKKNDTVKIIAGKDRGKIGKVMDVDSKRLRVTVEGLNLYKKHVRPRRQGEKGQVIQIPRPLHASNVMLACSSCGRAVRAGFRIENGQKSRFCKKCKATI